MWQSAGLLSCVRVVAKQTKYAHQPAKNWCARIYHLSLSLFRYHLFKITSFLINFRQLPCISSYKKQFHMPEYHFCPHYEAVHHNAAPESGSLLFHRLFPVRHKLLISLSEKNYSTIVFLCFSYTFWLYFVFRNCSSCSKFSSSWSNIRITSINCSFSRLS